LSFFPKPFTFNGRAVRPPQGPPLAAYPPPVRRVMFWYDSLSDWQRIQYAAVAGLFLLACGGYLLGLGSTIVLARVEAEQAALAAQPLPTLETAPTQAPATLAPTAAPSLTPLPSATPKPTSPPPSATPFTGPVIAEPPAVPRQLPAAPVVVAPAAPAAPRVTPTAKPRNVETSKPEPPAASVLTPTPGLVRNTPVVVVPTAVRAQATPTALLRVVTPLPTPPPTAPPSRGAPPTSAPTRAAAATPAAPAPTSVKTPVRQ
jgi:hypothetical protein